MKGIKWSWQIELYFLRIRSWIVELSDAVLGDYFAADGVISLTVGGKAASFERAMIGPSSAKQGNLEAFATSEPYRAIISSKMVA